ncbi:NAD(P)-dependent oxidoreductase [Rhizobium helianthi]|uniref:NAD(P)-dependent oxidoreductase n=1 Tax=Rhizobium helianthi TaxID=1132695 RepID=A0ABW4M323_9HYPH
MSEGQTPKIAFLGTGLMGAPMASRLLGAGYPVTVWNRDARKAQVLVGQGAMLAADPGDAVRDAEIVFTMLSDGQAVEDVLFKTGVASNLRRGATVIDCSSIAPPVAQDHARRLEERGVSHVDAPVSGGVVGAQAGTLAIMAGGNSEVIGKLKAIFAPLGRVTHVGPSGAGQICKLANQQIVAITIGALAEAMMLVEAGGASREKFREAIRGGFAESRILELHGARMVERQFEPGGPSRLQLKDLNAVAQMARDLSLTLPLTNEVRTAFEAFVADGHSETDHSGLLLHLEKINRQAGGSAN